MKIVVGLGNPGREYEGTRHNVGFAVVDAVADAAGAGTARRTRLARTGSGRVGREAVFFAKPRTFMNESGRAVQGILAAAGATVGDLLVVVDDIDLPLGRLRIRAAGSSGGHRGLASVEASLGTRDFARLRVGVGRGEGEDAADWVLSAFSRGERVRLPGIVARAAEAVRCWILEGTAAAMNRFNGPAPEAPGPA